MNWFYAQDGQQAGPVDDAELDRLVQTGVIADSTLVWHSGLANWQPYAAARVPVGVVAGGVPSNLPTYGSQSGLAKPLGSAGPGQAQCTQCGRVLPADEVVRIDNLDVCAQCKPVFLQRRREGATLRGFNTYAGFWIRFVAAFLDGLILIPAYILYFLVVNLITGGTGGSFNFSGNSFDSSFQSRSSGSPLALVAMGLFYLLVWFYVAYCVKRFGGTPGKRICKLRVVTGDGSQVSFGRALCRSLGKIVSGLILNLGYLFIVFDDQKRALHDMIVDTRVIYDGPR